MSVSVLEDWFEERLRRARPGLVIQVDFTRALSPDARSADASLNAADAPQRAEEADRAPAGERGQTPELGHAGGPGEKDDPSMQQSVPSARAGDAEPGAASAGSSDPSAEPSDPSADTARSDPAADAAPPPHPSVAVLQAVCRERARADAALVTSAVGIVDHCRPRVLERRGWLGVELNKTQQRGLLSETKRAAITEIQAATGFTTVEATSLVTLAMARSDLVSLVVEALLRGEASWAQVRRFVDKAFSGARDLSDDQRLLVATALFGTDEALAAPERLDPDGRLPVGEPWSHARYEAALDREVTACEGSDVAAEREKRARAYRSRRAWVRVHDDGTATLTIRGPAVPVVGTWARFDHIARNLRAGGADNTLDQLVVDSMLAVLGHGRLDLPEPQTLGELPEEELDDLIAVVNGMPRIALQVIVPVDALGIGHPVCAACATAIDDHPAQCEGPDAQRSADVEPSGDAGVPGDDGPPDADARALRRPERGRASGGRSPRGPDDRTDAGGGSSGASDDRAGPEGGSARPADDQPAADDRSTPPPDGGRAEGERCEDEGHDPALRFGRDLVGEVLGSHPFFITPGHARELFYTPGTTLHRLLTSPADGRLMERTRETYRPDADMRRQVLASDVYSRAPWTRLRGRSVEFDHVVPFSITDPDSGGPTSPTNLATLDKRTHRSKTVGLIGVHIDDRRDLTFTTLLGQITRSRVHDYRQYLLTLHPDDLDERRDRAARAVYAALVARPEARTRPGKGQWLSIDHTGPDGRRRPGPPEDPESLAEVLGLPVDEDS